MRTPAPPLAALALALAPAPASAILHAERVTEANASQVLVGGPDATGGVGDWALGNGTLCAIVSDPSHESDLSTRGGVLIDLGRCGRADDQLVILQPLLNLSRDEMVAITEVGARVAEGEASVETGGRHGGLAVRTRYALGVESPERLRVVTTVERVGEGGRAAALGDVLLHVDRALAPWGGALARGRTTGFRHPPLDLESVISILRAIRASDLHVLVGDPALSPEVAYGVHVRRAFLRGADGGERPVSVWSLRHATFSSFAALARPLRWGGNGERLGLLELVQLPFLDLREGEALVMERELVVSERADVASVLALLGADGHPVRGRVADPRAVVEAASEDGTPAGFARPDARGRFAFALPAGRYRFRARAPGERAAALAARTVDGPVELGELALPAPSRVLLPRGETMRLAFVGRDGTPDPRIGDDLVHLRIGDEVPPPSGLGRDVALTGRRGDPDHVVLAPGRYRVIATRGPEYDAPETEVELRAGETIELALRAPRRALETPGWISADLHVHAAPSDDSALPLDARARSFFAEGAEVLVATDHEHVTDYRPTLSALGLDGEVRSVLGVEVTGTVRTAAAPFTLGHANAFPLPHRPTAYRKGAPDNEARRLRAVIAAVRALPGPPLVQLNHARGSGGGMLESALFTHLGVGSAFDPRLPLGAEPNARLVERDPETGLRDLDFDAMELLNGPSLERYQALRDDWFALLRQGEVRAATANSDTHRISEPAAAPRSWLAVERDDPASVSDAELVAAIRAGRLVGSTGPLLEVRLGAAGVGGLHVGREGELRARVRAAPWVPVEELRVWVDGALVHEAPVAAGDERSVPLRFARDAFVTVEALGEAPPDSAYAALLPGFTPFAFTNPIFVDADGDGAWTPPAP